MDADMVREVEFGRKIRGYDMAEVDAFLEKMERTFRRKDLEQEFRTKEMLTSMGIYALLVLVVYGAALAQTTSTLDVLQMSGGLL